MILVATLLRKTRIVAVALLAVLAAIGATSNASAENGVTDFDLYRVDNVSDIDELGLEEALDEGAALIEWPEHAGSRLPLDVLHVALTLEPHGRSARISGPLRWATAFGEMHHAG